MGSFWYLIRGLIAQYQAVSRWIGYHNTHIIPKFDFLYYTFHLLTIIVDMPPLLVVYSRFCTMQPFRALRLNTNPRRRYYYQMGYALQHICMHISWFRPLSMVWIRFDGRIHFADTLAADAMTLGNNWLDPRIVYMGFTHFTVFGTQKCVHVIFHHGQFLNSNSNLDFLWRETPIKR